jgi:hypothetical protein
MRIELNTHNTHEIRIGQFADAARTPRAATTHLRAAPIAASMNSRTGTAQLATARTSRAAAIFRPASLRLDGNTVSATSAERIPNSLARAGNYVFYYDQSDRDVYQPDRTSDLWNSAMDFGEEHLLEAFGEAWYEDFCCKD